MDDEHTEDYDWVWVPPAPATALVSLKDQYFQLWKAEEARATALNQDAVVAKHENRVLRTRLARIERAVNSNRGSELDDDECEWCGL
jgi:hypothetical protein